MFFCRLKTAPSKDHKMDLCRNEEQKTSALTSLIVSSSFVRGQFRVKRSFQIANVCRQCQTLHFGIVFFVLHFKSKFCIKRCDLWEISNYFISSSRFVLFFCCIIRVRLCLCPRSPAIVEFCTEFLPESSTWNHSRELNFPLLTFSNNELWQCLWAHFHKRRNIIALIQT